MALMNWQRTQKKRTSLFARLSVPIFVLIVTFIALFSIASSYILIRVQNDHTRQMAEQSMKFVYRNVRYQFDTMSNVSAFIVANQPVENMMERSHSAPFEAVDDLFAMQTTLENLSVLSLVNDLGVNDVAQQSYTISLAVGKESGLYQVATDRFYPSTGIFKSDDLQDEPWFHSLAAGTKQTVWWGQKTGRSGMPMVFSARKKTGIKDGRTLATIIIGADTGSIKSVFSNAPLDKGYHLLLDERDRVIFSERFSFLEPMAGHPVLQGVTGLSGSVSANVDGEQDRIMYETLDNGWKVLTVVPESHFGQYTLLISALGAITAAGTLLVAGLWLRKIVVRVTVPVTRLVSAIQRPEVVAFKEPVPKQRSGIYEVDELNEKFAEMLVTIRGLIEKSFAEEMERRELQLELLHAQINPHFLYNTLDLINCRALMSGDMETSRIVRSLANVFRFGLNQGQSRISLGDEVKQVEAYLHIQKMMLEQLETDIRIPDELLAVTVVHLCLQPLAENAIVHGFADQSAQCRLAISARVDGTKLILRVADNGKGCDAARMNRELEEQSAEHAARDQAGGTGYGTLNVHRRIQLHCGQAYGLRYLEAEQGTCVDVVLPLRLQESVS